MRETRFEDSCIRPKFRKFKNNPNKPSGNPKNGNRNPSNFNKITNDSLTMRQIKIPTKSLNQKHNGNKYFNNNYSERFKRN